MDNEKNLSLEQVIALREAQYLPTESEQVSDTVNPILQNCQEQQKCKMEQMEFESIVEPIDEKSAFVRHKEAMAKRWFGYYRKCQ